MKKKYFEFEKFYMKYFLNTIEKIEIYKNFSRFDFLFFKVKCHTENIFYKTNKNK